MGLSVNFQSTELSRLSTVGYCSFYSMPESILRKVTCSVTSLIFLVIVLSCSKLMSGCQGQDTRSLQKSYKKKIKDIRDTWFTQLWIHFIVFCYKTPSSLAEIY